MKKAFITGVTGQDGAYLSQLLLTKGYHVYGLTRQPLSPDFVSERLRWLGIAADIELVAGNLTDLSSLTRLLRKIQPDEVYNLAAQSLVNSSWDQPLVTGSVTGLGATTVLEAIRLECPQARFYQASSSEMFGLVQEPVQNEKTPFYARSPYAAAKIYAHWITVNYREALGLHASAGILFNHESPLRGLEFVSRKVTDSVARIKLGLADRVALGNLEVKRDWGHARDYVRAMWLMLQQDVPEDYVVATGRTTSLREFCDIAFGALGLRADDHITVARELFRPTDVSMVCGDASKANARLGWSPTVSLEAMISEMLEADLSRCRSLTQA
jgi:GDPmannose 4,6-dehydratase